MSRGRKFTLDKANGKLMGVCAGIADMTGWDVTLVRVGLVVVTLLGGFPWTLVAYLAAAMIARPKARDRFENLGSRSTSAFELRRSTTDLDRRLAEIDSYMASQDNSLAHEIESLR
ncbi:MAG TPA: PspC domain-containing protein [Allosphingosinicella sp.]|jgi:phage shock protein C|nr:PspC domain-containing protein [Allosphingosinicella sp.]